MRSVIEEAVVVACQCESYPHGHVPCDSLGLLFAHLGEDGKRKVVEPYTGVPAMVDRTGLAVVDAVHLCLSCVSCRGGSGLSWRLVLPPAR